MELGVVRQLTGLDEAGVKLLATAVLGTLLMGIQQ